MEKQKNQKVQKDMLRSIGKQSGESVESVRKKKRKATSERICRKLRFFSLERKSEGVMDDKSGESMEPMEEVPLKELCESELERLVRGCRAKLFVASLRILRCKLDNCSVRVQTSIFSRQQSGVVKNPFYTEDANATKVLSSRVWWCESD